MSVGVSGSPAPATSAVYRWERGRFELLDYCDTTEQQLEVADSWLVSDGSALALELHRTRFLASVAARGFDQAPAEEAWEAAIAMIPSDGSWFPRIELRSLDGSSRYLFRLRDAPARSDSVVLATAGGEDPRTAPTIKGPDLAAMLRLRTEVQQRGADDAVLLSPLGFVVEGAHTALLWWRGEILCAPAEEFERIDSVTAKSILALATVLGTDIYHEAVTPAELDGVELWAVNALHGIRIVTSWVDGPSMAEQPGRLRKWQSLLNNLRQPLQSERGSL
ncbi:aminotransferase class IV [Parafrigoribacterium humi]|jgi:branched-subunit amino acid aminotransferase/4-amino-4-deoxychorismate lyase|uniref:aminotransferase class IV n=1 Tax=Parafrigoribacterium humi TaxID=3144664 RepID=UPI0032EC1A73